MPCYSLIYWIFFNKVHEYHEVCIGLVQHLEHTELRRSVINIFMYTVMNNTWAVCKHENSAELHVV